MHVELVKSLRPYLVLFDVVVFTLIHMLGCKIAEEINTVLV